MTDPFARDDEENEDLEVDETSEPTSAPANVISMAPNNAQPARRPRAAAAQAPQSQPARKASKPEREGHKGKMPGPQEFSTNEVDLLLPEIIDKITEAGFSLYDLNSRVIIIEPGPKHMVGRWFDCAGIMGDQRESPSDALVRIVTDYYHMPTAKAGALYEIQFFWKSTGHIYARGQLRLASPSELIAAANAMLALNEAQVQHNRQPPPLPQRQPQQQQPDYSAQQQYPQQYSPQQQPGFGPPPYPQYPQQQHPGYGAPYGQQPQQQQPAPQVHVAPGPSTESMARLEAEMGYLKGKIDQVLTQRAGAVDTVDDPDLAEWRAEQRYRPPFGDGFGGNGFGGGFSGAPAAPAVAPQQPPSPPPVVDEDRIVNRILSALGARAYTFQSPPPPPQQQQQPQAPPPVAAAPAYAPPPQQPMPPPVPAPAPQVQQHIPTAKDGFRAFIREERERRSMMRDLRSLLDEDEPETEDPQTPPPPPAVVTPPAPGTGLPFGVTAVPESRWSNGSQVNYAQDAKTGKIDPLGSVAANPIMIERVLDGVNSLFTGLGQLAANAAKQSHVVEKTPSDAQDGTPKTNDTESDTDDNGWPTL